MCCRPFEACVFCLLTGRFGFSHGQVFGVGGPHTHTHTHIHTLIEWQVRELDICIPGAIVLAAGASVTSESLESDSDSDSEFNSRTAY